MAASWIKRAMCYMGLADDDDLPTERVEIESAPGRDPLIAPAPLPEPEWAMVRLVDDEPAPVPEQFAAVRIITPTDAQMGGDPADHVAYLAPETFDEVTEIADRVVDGWTVELSLDRVAPALKRRIIDFCSGLVYARGGTMRRSGPSDYLLSAPAHVSTGWERELRRLA
jgi:cell division inhibitor SepF